MRQKYKEPPTQKTHIGQNPYAKSNPYKPKAKLLETPHSKQPRSRYQSTGSSHSNQNPQSLYYKRNYKQTPPAQQNNYVSLLNQPFGKKQSFHEIDYRIQLKNYLTDKFCPTDGYLEVVKDKFMHYNGERDSQFQNVMRTSHVTKGKSYSGYSNRNDSYSSKVTKENPFLRKNLLSASTQRSGVGIQISSLPYSGQKYLLSSSQALYSSTIDNSYISSTPQDYLPPKYSPRQSHMQKKSSFQESSIYANGTNNSIHENRGYDLRSHPGNESPMSNNSFGPDKWIDAKKKMHSLVDAVIERSLEDQNHVQQKAPKEIKLNGKSFFLQPVKRLGS